MKNKIIVLALIVFSLFLLRTALLAQSEIETPIVKDIAPQEIAGDLAVKISCKFIIVDSMNNDVIVSDVMRYNEESDEYEVYYQDIAFTWADLPCELSSEEIEALK